MSSIVSANGICGRSSRLEMLRLGVVGLSMVLTIAVGKINCGERIMNFMGKWLIREYSSGLVDFSCQFLLELTFFLRNFIWLTVFWLEDYPAISLPEIKFRYFTPGVPKSC
jgi:hypothetical protein